MLLRVLVGLVALASARAHQAFSAASDDNDCALYLSGPGRTSAFDYNLNLLRGNFGYDGQHTCITYDAVNQAYLDARKRINVAQPKGDWKAEDIASAGELMLDISINLARTYGLTYEEIEKGLPLIDTSKTLIREACPPVFSHVECRPGKYRRFDGLCNNLQHPTWGATMSPFQRLIGPLFADGINAPRISTTGRDLPLSRIVSRTMHPDDGFHDHAGTVMVIAWGQFMDHDYTLTATPLDPRNRNDPEECCKRPPHLKHPYCNEIRIPDDDYFYRLFHVKCIDFVRAFPSPRPGCRLGSRVPYNTLTGVLDGNTVYGVTEKFARKLRTGFGGLLRMNPVFEEYGLKDLLPLKLDIPDEGCTRPNKSMFCFEAGEIRVNEQLVLTCMHTLMAREHNRAAKGLAKVNQHWDDETLFQEARRITIAEIQHITYNEFLPILLGKDVMEKFGLLLQKEGYWDGYDQSVNPDVIDAFASAAFRFGHSLLPTAVERWSKAHKFIASKRLSDLIRRPYDLYRAGVLDEYLMGLMNQVAQAMDDSITQEVTNHLFKKVGARFGMDLVSFNMQRGREFGIPGYMEFRKFCGLPGADSFQELFGSMPNETIRKYESIFEHPSDVDLWSGGVSERPLPGSMLGPTFACVIATQFSYSRRGDRFWYELPHQPSSFTPEQLAEVRKARLSRIICDNTDIIDTVQVYPMVLPDHELNPRVPCRSGIIPSIDFSKWAEHPPAFDRPSRPYITEALYSNETLKLDTENSTLGNDEDKSLEHTAGVVNAENCTITTDDSVNITDTTDSTNVQLLKYVVKQNETGSPGDKNSGHYKNALKRKRRATTGIFDPHPALATLPLRIIADDDFFSIPGDNVATTHKPVIKENLKATAPQVFPQFTLVPVLPPGYLERYNVSTEVNHPVVNKNSDASKPSKSSSKSKITHYYETKSDNENEPKHPKPKSNNFESGGSSINNKYNSELDDFENYERPYNSHPHKKMNNHKQIKQYINNENDDDDDNTSRVQDRTRDHFDTHSDKPKHSQNSYSHPYHNSESNSYEFAPKRIIKPSEDSKNVPYEEDHDDDENRDTYKTSKDGKANHISENNLSKKETNLNNDREQENGFIPETRSSEEENENTHFKDNKEVVHHTYDGNKHRKEDNFRPNAHISTSKNKLTAPLFKPNGYIVPDGPQKIHREEEDTVEDYDDQPVIPKSKLETKNLDEPEAHTHSETYDDDNSREYRNYPKSPEVNNHNVHQDSKTTNIQLDRYNIQKDANENIEAKSGGFKSQNMEDDTLPENEEPDTTKFRKTYNEHNSSDDNEDDEKPSLHYTERKPNYERANNAYSKPAAHASSEENYDDTEDKNESEILRENSERQEEYPKYRSSHTSENKESYPPATNIERHSKDTEENSNEDDSKENKSHNDYYSQKNSNERLEKTDNRDAEDDSEEHGQEKPLRQPYNLKLNINERFKQNPREGSDENVSSEDSDRIVSKSFSVNPIEAPVENKRHTSDTGSEEINNEDEDRDKPKLLYENFQSHDYPTRKPAAFSKGNEDSGNGNSKSSYIIKNNSEPDGKNGPGEFAEENYNGNNKAKISYETYHPSIDEHPKRIPTGFSKENQDNGKVNAKISFETFHPLNSEFPKPKSLEKYSGELNIKPTLSYETYHPPVNAAEYRKPDPTEPTHENLDKNGKAQISYETYHPQGNMYDNSQEILAEPELKFNQALITPVNPKVSYETYHPLVRSNEYSQPEVISKGNVEENARSIQPTQYFEIFSQAKSPTVLPNDHGNSQHDKSSYPSKEIQGKPPKKYKPKPIFYDYNSFNPYKNLYPGAVKKVPKLPMFYSKKHSELPELGIKDSQGNVKQQFERIPLNYMHDSQNPRKPKVQGNKLSYVNIPYTPKENENLSSKEDKEDVEGNKPSIKYKTDLDIKLDDLKLDLPEIKLPESVLLYDSEEKEQNDSSGDKTEKYKVKEEDSEEDEDAEEEPEEEPEEAAEEEEDEEENNHRPPPPRHDNNNSPKYSDYKSEDDLYGKFFNDNIDLYESFVQDHFNKKGTFAERSQDIIEDPVLKSTMQDVLRRVAKSTKEAEKSEDPKYGYKWILNYGRPL